MKKQSIRLARYLFPISIKFFPAGTARGLPPPKKQPWKDSRQSRTIPPRLISTRFSTLSPTGRQSRNRDTNKTDRRMTVKSGYGVFGKAYETMLRNDPHAKGSIDRLLMRQMRLVDKASYSALYKKTPSVPPQIKRHECFLFAQQCAAASRIYSGGSPA